MSREINQHYCLKALTAPLNEFDLVSPKRGQFPAVEGARRRNKRDPGEHGEEKGGIHMIREQDHGRITECKALREEICRDSAPGEDATGSASLALYGQVCGYKAEK